MIMEMLKEDNTLSALDIQKKLIDKWVSMSTSTIRRALKMRKYTYKNKYCYNDLNIESNESKKMFWEICLEED